MFHESVHVLRDHKRHILDKKLLYSFYSYIKNWNETWFSECDFLKHAQIQKFSSGERGSKPQLTKNSEVFKSSAYFIEGVQLMNSIYQRKGVKVMIQV